MYRVGIGLTVLVFGQFQLDTERHVLLAGGRQVGIRGRPVEILSVLAAKAGHVLSNEEITAQVWNGIVVGENNLPVQMSILRRCLKIHGADGVIETVANQRGYRFLPEVRIVAETASRPTSVAVRSPPVVQDGGADAALAVPAAGAADRSRHRDRWVAGMAALSAALTAIAWAQRPVLTHLPAHVRVEAQPDTIMMLPEGFCRVDYEFRVLDQVEMQLATEDVRFHLISGEPISQASVRGRIYHGSFPIRGPGVGVYHNNIYLPASVVAAARANGRNDVYLRHLFHLTDPQGREVDVPAVLQIVFATASDACRPL